jgi:thiamine kinase-like enzyme
MSSLMTAMDALNLVPDWDVASTQISELEGGLTNRSYYVRSGDRECVLRIDAEHTSAVLADRSCELAILERAGRAGIAPGIVYSDIDTGILLTEFLPGPVWKDIDLENPGHIEVLADVLRQVHALPLCGFRIDLNLSAARYEQALQERHGLHDFASRCVGIINSIPGGDTFVCCHNDVIAGNIIGSTSVKMIDWEYAGDNDPLFDLASVIGYHDFDKQRTLRLLGAYAGSAVAEMQEQLADQLRLYDAIQWLWLATRHRAAPNQKQAARLEELRQRIR